MVFGRDVIEEQPREPGRLPALGASPAALRLALTFSEHRVGAHAGSTLGVPY
jgi:hypothetical protein